MLVVELQPVALTHVVVALRVDHGVDMVYATGLDSREGDVQGGCQSMMPVAAQWAHGWTADSATVDSAREDGLDAGDGRSSRSTLTGTGTLPLLPFGFSNF